VLRTASGRRYGAASAGVCEWLEVRGGTECNAANVVLSGLSYR
jgi:hypothetical protein